ncbi:MAG: glutamate--cysteine ligase [Actinomycetales bacterium]|nr:MAG: glutamate--cysteine ligase [Actinomycetales bacterium]
MRITFAASEKSSVGIEWEVGLVDENSLEFVPAAPEILSKVEDPHDGPIRQEFFANMVELVTGVHRQIAPAIADLRRSLQQASEFAADVGVSIVASGSHPFSNSGEQNHYKDPRYLKIADRLGYWAKHLTICGTHIHIGIDHQDKALPITYGIARFIPYFIALSASSPYWNGEETKYASHRTMLFQQLPTNGLPYPLDSWAEYEQYAAQLKKVQMIASAKDIRWDVRPSPGWGTVENRVMDSMPTLREVAAVAALSQCLIEFMSRELDRGTVITRLPVWFMKENKWRAARYGLETDVITPLPHQPIRPLTEGLLEWIERLEPVAEELGCYEELVFCRKLVDHGPSYLRQRRVADENNGDLKAVTQSLADEMKNESPLF